MLPASVQTWLGRPRVHWAAALLAMLLASPALFAGLILDDHYLRLVFKRSQAVPHLASAGDPFRFVTGDPGLNAELRELGFLPWWAPDQIRIAFFRPLSTWTHQLDYALWPDATFAMHAHSLLWMVALIAAAAALYRRLAGGAPWVAGLAIVLFAIDDSHALPAGWLANRNALVAGTFVALTVVFHDRWRSDGYRPGAALGPAAFVLALLGGELGIAALGFLVAHAWWIERAPWPRRAAALAPYLFILGVWAAVYSALGYGCRGSGLYVDPMHEPLVFLAHVAKNAPVLWFGLFAGAQVGLFSFLEPGPAMAMVLVGCAGCIVVAVVLGSFLRHDRGGRFWATAALLSSLPALATFAADRLLLVPGMAALGLLARYVASVGDPARSGVPARGTRWFAIAILIGHGAASAAAFPAQIMFAKKLAEIVARGGRSVPATLSGQTLVVVNAPDVLACNHLPFWRASTGYGELPARVRCIGVARGPLRVERPEPQSLVFRPQGGYLGATIDHLYRSPTLRPRAGERFELSDTSFEILEVSDGGLPLSVKVRFSSSLDAPQYRFVVWHDRGYVAFELPPVGQVKDIEPRTLVDLLLVF